MRECTLATPHCPLAKHTIPCAGPAGTHCKLSSSCGHTALHPPDAVQMLEQPEAVLNRVLTFLGHDPKLKVSKKEVRSTH